MTDLCSSGGYFIGTCYDGSRVFDMFSTSQKSVVEMKDNQGSLIYQIKKLYDTPVFNYEKNTLTQERCYG